MFYYTYKITLTKGSLKNHYYLGMHSTDNINDNYKGSGKILLDYYKKYPNDYIKEIICYYNDFDNLYKAEKELISDLYKNDDKCINIKPGGNGGSYKGINKGIKRSEEQKIRHSNRLKERYRLGEIQPWNKGIPMSEETKKKLSKSHKGKISPRKGCHLLEETKQKISKHFIGRSPSNKGIPMSEEDKKKLSITLLNLNRKWMTDKYSNYLVPSEYWQDFIDIGFYFGRTINL